MRRLLFTLSILKLGMVLRELGKTPCCDGNWDESKHPRGNPANAGQFAKKGEGGLSQADLHRAAEHSPKPRAATEPRKHTPIKNEHIPLIADACASRGFTFTPGTPAPFEWDHKTGIKGPTCFANVVAQRAQRMGIYAIANEAVNGPQAKPMFGLRQLEYGENFRRLGGEYGITTVPEIADIRKNGRNGDSISAWGQDRHNRLFTIQDGKWYMDDGYYGIESQPVSDSFVADNIMDSGEDVYYYTVQAAEQGDRTEKANLLQARHRAKIRLSKGGVAAPTNEQIEKETANILRDAHGSFLIPAGSPILESEWKCIAPFTPTQPE